MESRALALAAPLMTAAKGVVDARHMPGRLVGHVVFGNGTIGSLHLGAPTGSEAHMFSEHAVEEGFTAAQATHHATFATPDSSGLTNFRSFFLEVQPPSGEFQRWQPGATGRERYALETHFQSEGLVIVPSEAKDLGAVREIKRLDESLGPLGRLLRRAGVNTPAANAVEGARVQAIESAGKPPIAALGITQGAYDGSSTLARYAALGKPEDRTALSFLMERGDTSVDPLVARLHASLAKSDHVDQGAAAVMHLMQQRLAAGEHAQLGADLKEVVMHGAYSERDVAVRALLLLDGTPGALAPKIADYLRTDRNADSALAAELDNHVRAGTNVAFARERLPQAAEVTHDRSSVRLLAQFAGLDPRVARVLTGKDTHDATFVEEALKAQKAIDGGGTPTPASHYLTSPDFNETRLQYDHSHNTELVTAKRLQAARQINNDLRPETTRLLDDHVFQVGNQPNYKPQPLIYAIARAMEAQHPLPALASTAEAAARSARPDMFQYGAHDAPMEFIRAEATTLLRRRDLTPTERTLFEELVPAATPNKHGSLTREYPLDLVSRAMAAHAAANDVRASVAARATPTRS